MLTRCLFSAPVARLRHLPASSDRDLDFPAAAARRSGGQLGGEPERRRSGSAYGGTELADLRAAADANGSGIRRPDPAFGVLGVGRSAHAACQPSPRGRRTLPPFYAADWAWQRHA